MPGGGSHQGALALIPAAAAAEHRDDTARGHRPEGLPGLGQGLRRVGKVDEDAAAPVSYTHLYEEEGNGAYFFVRQCIFAALGLVVMFIRCV